MLPVKKTSKIIVKKRTLPDERPSTEIENVRIGTERLAVANTDTTNISFDDLSTRFDDLSTRFDTLSTRFNEVYTRFNEVSTGFDEMSKQIEELSTKLSNRLDKLEDLSSSVDAQWRFDIENRISGITSVDLPDLKYLILQRTPIHDKREIETQTECEIQTQTQTQNQNQNEDPVSAPMPIHEDAIQIELVEIPVEVQDQNSVDEQHDLPSKQEPTEEEKQETPQEPTSSSVVAEPEIIISKFNEAFDATFILDITGTAEAMAVKLHNIGVKNCVIVSPDLPNDCLPKDRIVYFIHSAIDTAKEEGWNTVNIIANHLLPHKNLFEAIYISLPLIQSVDWQVLHYCSNNHTYEPPQMELNLFNWRNYVILNPDLPEIVRTNEARATQDWCTRGYRTGRSANPKLLPTNTHNTLAFCLKSSAFDTILKNLETAISASRELPLLDVPGLKMILSPNLFIVPGTGASIMKELRWLPQLYLEA